MLPQLAVQLLPTLLREGQSHGDRVGRSLEVAGLLLAGGADLVDPVPGAGSGAVAEGAWRRSGRDQQWEALVALGGEHA